MDALCLISVPRTGTAHLTGMLRNFSELSPLGGIFAARDPAGLDPALLPSLRVATGIDFVSLRDPQLRTLVERRPGAWLDALEGASRAAGKRLLSFRLWPDDLPLDMVESEVLPRPGMRMVVVVRRQIDTYVSWRKAVGLGRTEGDTTGIRLNLDIDHFEPWLDRVESWYRHWRDLLARRFLPCPILRYESDIDIPLERALRRFASAAALVGISLRLPVQPTFAGLQRQDQARAVADKVTNWPEFSRGLMERGLERRAFGYPI